jgi:hypothetical protein
VLAHQLGGGLEAVLARKEFPLGLEEINKAFRGEVLG